MIHEISESLCQKRIYEIAASRTRRAGVPEKAHEVANEVIRYRQAENDQQVSLRRFKTPIDQSHLPELSALGKRVSFLSGLVYSSEERTEAIRQLKAKRVAQQDR